MSHMRIEHIVRRQFGRAVILHKMEAQPALV